MSMFNQTFTLANNTAYPMVLDSAASQHLGHDWPQTIPANSAAATFEQTGTFDINPIAVYLLEGNPATSNVRMNFFCANLATIHVHMTMEFGGEFIPGSSIAENNTQRGEGYITSDTPTANGVLEIKTDGLAKTTGNAIFIVGN